MASLYDFCEPSFENSELSPLLIMTLNKDNNSLKQILKNLRIKQNEDEFCRNIIDHMRNDNNNHHRDDANYQIYDGLLFRKDSNENNWKIIIPTEIKFKIIEYVHNKLWPPWRL